eukprot:SAG31_NODE_156_length_22055_cov_105.227728_16_plen_68_part_00
MKKLERIKLAAEKYEKYLAMLEFQEDDLIIMVSSSRPRLCRTLTRGRPQLCLSMGIVFLRLPVTQSA